MDPLSVARAMATLLQPLHGQPSVGFVQASAIGADVVLPAGTYGYPVVNGKLDDSMLVKVTASTTVTAAGTAVPVKTVCRSLDLPAGTVVRWNPPVAGLQPTAAINAPGLSGGTRPAQGDWGVLRSIRVVTDPDQIDDVDMDQSGAGLFPAALIAWSETARQAANVARRDTLIEERWSVAVAVGRTDGQAQRSAEGLYLMGAVSRLLHKRCNVDGVVISAPEPLLVIQRGVVPRNRVNLYTLGITSNSTLSGIDDRDFPVLSSASASWPLTGDPPGEEVFDGVRFPIQ